MAILAEKGSKANILLTLAHLKKVCTVHRDIMSISSFAGHPLIRRKFVCNWTAPALGLTPTCLTTVPYSQVAKVDCQGEP